MSTVRLQGRDVKVTFVFEAEGRRVEVPLQDNGKLNTSDPEDLVGVATPDEIQRYVDALNNQPCGTCVKAGCKNERMPWRVIGGSASGSAFCAEHLPRML